MPPSKSSIVIKSALLQRMHLNRRDQLLNIRGVQILQRLFASLDVHEAQCLNDLQTLALLRCMTNLKEPQCYVMFDMLDLDNSGSLEVSDLPCNVRRGGG